MTGPKRCYTAPVTMNFRRGFRSAILASLAVVAAELGQAAPLPKTTPAAFDSAAIKKHSAWDAQCRAGTFDIRGVRVSDLPTRPEMPLALACVSLASPPSSPSKPSGNSPVDKESDGLVNYTSAIHEAMSGKGEPGDQLYRLLASRSPSEEFSSRDRQRSKLFVTALRQNQGSDALCKQARLLELADEHWGCSTAMSVLDGHSNRCDNVKCREVANLVAALRSHDLKDCSSSPFCRVLSSHDVRACEPYLKQADKVFCDLNASNVAQIKHQEEQKEKDALAKGFKKGQPMQTISPEVQKRMKKIEGK